MFTNFPLSILSTFAARKRRPIILVLLLPTAIVAVCDRCVLLILLLAYAVPLVLCTWTRVPDQHVGYQELHGIRTLIKLLFYVDGNQFVAFRVYDSKGYKDAFSRSRIRTDRFRCTRCRRRRVDKQDDVNDGCSQTVFRYLYIII
jgi:hypothetical protein